MTSPPVGVQEVAGGGHADGTAVVRNGTGVVLVEEGPVPLLLG